jgi:outer membrane protein with beta-barrel domain
MKRIILSLASVAMIATAANAQLAIAPELGLNMANLTGKSGGSSVGTSMKAGVAVGAVIDLGITDNIYFQPGLFYEMTGCKFTGTPTAKYNINTITIPLNFEYKTGEEGGSRFFVGIGPYIGYNISGTYSIDAAGGIPSSSGTLKIGSAKPDASGNGGDDIKALDFGAGVNVGYLLANGFYARVHYQMGFAELNPVGDANNSMKASGLGVTVGYYFGAKKAKGGGGAKKK